MCNDDPPGEFMKLFLVNCKNFVLACRIEWTGRPEGGGILVCTLGPGVSRVPKSESKLGFKKSVELNWVETLN